MRQRPVRPQARSCRWPRGFTLIELMISIAVIAVLSALALPGYREHIVRTHLVDATNGLSAMRANMERHFQDNRTYASVTGFANPCAAATTVGNFSIVCDGTPDATSFTVKATGSGNVSGFVFKITHADVRSTTSAPTGWTTCATQWITKKGQACT